MRKLKLKYYPISFFIFRFFSSFCCVTIYREYFLRRRILSEILRGRVIEKTRIVILENNRIGFVKLLEMRDLIIT